ncbi:hypothetical protein AB0O91_00225 [Kitasatospora sp. NPDC089797]|uniref:hypothetical protein n=1 Tax=Kitasatospora sp. NPDC089797 TaxID=3155298 RepID=UPI00343F05AD
MPSDANQPPPTGPTYWESRCTAHLGSCAGQLTLWGHDLTDGAWPDVEDLGILLTHTIRDLEAVEETRVSADLLSLALVSVRAADRWLSAPCRSSPAMAALLLREAAGLMRCARERLLARAPGGRPYRAPERTRQSGPAGV